MHKERYGGVGLLERMRGRGDHLPTEKARDVQERLKREKLLRSGPGGQGMGDRITGSGEEFGGIAAMGKKLWMGEEGEGWKEKRMREEREAMEEGKGYGGMIMDQIWEVWNWGKTEDDDEQGGEQGGEGEDGGKGEVNGR